MADGPTISPDDVSPHVHVKISKEKKIEWLNYAFEHYRGNLSTLVVEAVDNTINDEWVLAGEDTGEEVNVDFSGVDDDLDEIKGQMSALAEQVDALTLAQTEPEGYEELDRDELLTLANRVRDVLPEVPNEWVLTHILQETVADDVDHPETSGSAEDIAEYLGEHRHHVHDAAVLLEQEPEVESVLDGSVRRWYVRNPTLSVDDYVGDPEDLPDGSFATGDTVDREGQKELYEQSQEEK
ncbi:uncharacterized protein Nmag_0234 [Natrialba magadii ATCC 43099]|uniref:Uncharacterized protein n=1 Tax=Natrialba magadii (strain ATCC 43099 / DSM 3394 / CCM 3739 / CIP 104546 / IAM 13178 / JCM 8861 / NBRC 102185 / NCIMB 2190 / MS3) TaxID=547559 RepID=D3SWN4_NATMM|nr:hypothetical protein [Natrialba magadii]ADD03826.1 uncharacterized protein Nmag_0234 [Natrialba magadii ATCC 43099]ELY33489.1 hypothetical protein C500_01615 [Natrialba magadii ATCC 43099]